MGTRKIWSDWLTFGSSIGLAAATIPELVKAFRAPDTVHDISLLYIILRGAFFVVLAISLFIIPAQYKVFNTRILAWLSVWYVIFYIILLALRAKASAKSNEQKKNQV